MKHIRIIALSLAIVLVVGLFAACGKNDSGSKSDSSSQPDVSVSMPEADVSAPGDVSQPEAEAPAPEVKPEEKPETPEAKPQQKPEEKPEPPAPEAKPEQKPEAPAPEVKPEEKPEEPAPEAKPEEKPEEPAPAGVDLAAFFETIFTDPENTPALMPMEADALDAFYPGLTALSLNQTAAYMPMMTAVPCEIVMVECANAADVDAVKTLFQARIAAQVDNHFNYPMVIEAWETEAQVVSNGNFVALFVVSGMTEEVVSNFNALF